MSWKFKNWKFWKNWTWKDSYTLTKKELLLATFLGIFGFFTNSRWIILWLDSIGIVGGYIFYNIIYFGFLFILSRAGLTLFGLRIERPLQTIGLFLLTTAVFMTIEWESPWINIVTKGTVEGVSIVYWQTDDGISWIFWSNLLGIYGITNPDIIAIFTYPITIFFLALMGGFLITGRIKIQEFPNF